MEKWIEIRKSGDFTQWGNALGIDPLCARIIRNRGIESIKEAEDYLSGETGELRLLYNDAKSDMVNVVENYRLLPLDRDEFIENGVSGKKSHLDFAQRPEAILANMMPRYITGCLYGALTDSYCAEQNARMAAMKAANDSADELLSKLKINYNRARQGAITQEITEIAAGARAQKLNRKKKKGEEN